MYEPYADPPSVIWNVSSNEVVRTNRAFELLLDLNRADLANQPLLDWIHPDDISPLEHALRAGTGATIARHRAKNGEWVRFDWMVKSDCCGTFAFGRFSTNVDGQGDEPKASGDAATASETLNSMALIVETSNPGLRCSILLVDAETGRIKVGAGPSLPREYNDAVEELQIGPTLGSCGTAAYWNVPVVVENIDEDYLWRDLKDAAGAAGVKACWSYPILATDGVVLGAIALYANQPQSPTASQMDGLEIAARMIGLAIERDRLEAQLLQAAKLEAIGRLSSGIAHDFNNILTVILGHIELLRVTPTASPDCLDAISHAVNRASEITSKLLAFGRKQTYCPERVDVGAVVVDVMRVLKPVIGDDVSVSLSLDPSALWITADRTQFSQIVLNLVINARDAMPSCGGHIEIKTRHASHEDTSRVKLDAPRESLLVIEVTDNGSGMDAQTASHVFEPFYSTKEDGNSGLGLSTVYGLTRQNRGFVAVESEPGKGTTFFLYFPKSDGMTTSPKTRRTNDSQCASVLLVEDSDEIRDVVTKVLETEAYQVTQARHGAEAVSLVEDGLTADIVVTDVMMPVMGGVPQIRRLRSLLPDLRVLYMSGCPADSLDLPDLESTGDRFLAKPFTPPQLLSEIRDTLRETAKCDVAGTD